MKRAIVFVAAMLMMGPVLWAAPFTQGNLVILRVGPGTEALTNAGNTLFLDEYTTNGAFVQAVLLPTNQFVTAGGVTNYPIDLTGGNTSEGDISLSTDGRYVVIFGFGTNRLWYSTNGGNISTYDGGAAIAIPRVVARVDRQGNIDTSTAIGNIFFSASGGDPRGVASTDGSNFWVAASTCGISYAVLGSNTCYHCQGGDNKRTVAIFNQFAGTVFPPSQQQVYSASAGGIYTDGTNYPTGESISIFLSNTVNSAGALASPYGFLGVHLKDGISSNIDTIYIADDGTQTGGISKWTYNPTTTNFNQTGSISAVNSAYINTNGSGGVRCLTGTVSVNGNQTNVTLYVTASANTGNIFGELFKLTDSTGYGGTLTGTLPAPIATLSSRIVTALWRGIAFAPSDFRVTSIARSGNNVSLTWSAMGGRSYIVQGSPGNGSGGYDGAVFSDISGTNFTLGFGATQAGYVDTTGTYKYYRVKLVPAQNSNYF